jgi:hypothetical protein
MDLGDHGFAVFPITLASSGSNSSSCAMTRKASADGQEFGASRDCRRPEITALLKDESSLSEAQSLIPMEDSVGSAIS